MKLFFLFFLVVLPNLFFAQSSNKIDNSSRSKYIFDIAKYVTWPNEASIDTFKLCVLSKDTNLFSQLKKTVATQGLLHKKPVFVISTSDLHHIPACNFIFFNHEEGYDIDKVNKTLNNNNILLLTENYEFHKSMINFIYVNKLYRYELNIAKLNETGFKVSDLFIESAIKSQTDWQKLYNQTDIALQKEKDIVEQQSLQITQQREEIEKQQLLIAKQQGEINEQLRQIEKQKQTLTLILKQVKVNELLLQKKMLELTQREQVLQAKNDEINEKSKILANQKSEIDKQNSRIEKQKKVLNEQLAKIHMQQIIMYMFVAFIFMLVFLGFFIYRNYKIKKEANRKLSLKNEEIMKQKEEILTQRNEIEIQKNIAVNQRDEITLQKQEIMDSIKYASRIQQAVLPPIKKIQNLLFDNFFLFNRPRDIVSGDYYFITAKNNKLIVSAADCTGHGVPGAFMSLLGISFLNEIVGKMEVLDASLILNQLRENIINALNQSGTDQQTKDGMDMVLCVFDYENYVLEFAGANNPLYQIRNGELMEYKGDKMPIGIYDELKPFTKHVIKMEKGDAFYLFSDGYADQFGGPNGKKFKYKPLKELLLSIQQTPMTEQLHIIEKTIDDWKKDYFQVDDMLLIGIKF
jgi:serine phosphatase RsbU (regulator of sigma subunit)